MINRAVDIVLVPRPDSDQDDPRGATNAALTTKPQATSDD